MKKIFRILVSTVGTERGIGMKVFKGLLLLSLVAMASIYLYYGAVFAVEQEWTAAILTLLTSIVTFAASLYVSITRGEMGKER